MADKVKRIGHLLGIAVSFLTIFPVPRREYRGGDLACASFAFPLVGLGIGTIVWGARFLAEWRTKDPLFSSFLALLVWVFLTRGLHLDGVADVCDALFSGRDKEGRRLILKDPRVGTFGVLGVLFTLGIKGASIFGLHELFPFLFVPVLGRVVALLFGAFFSPPSLQGLGGEFVGRVRKEVFLFWWAILLVWGFEVGGFSTLLKTIFTFGIMFTLGKKLSFSLGGLSGDVVGAGIEWGEAVFLFLLRV